MNGKLSSIWRELNQGCPKGYGFGEVLTVAVLYVFLAKLFLAGLGNFNPFSGLFEGAEAGIARSFTFGAAFQLAFLGVMVFVFKSRTTKAALKSLSEKAPRRGWMIAGAIVLVEVGIVGFFFIPEPSMLLGISFFSLTMALVPALDGFTQEVVFRGYLLRRLDGAGFGKAFQIVLSGLAFGALHFNYGGGGETLSEMLIPALGTFGLGAVLAFACQKSDYKILPVVVAHVLIILFLQPELALSSLGQ